MEFRWQRPAALVLILFAPACHRVPTPSPSPEAALSFSVSTEVGGSGHDTLVVRTSIRNEMTKAVHLSFGRCALRVQLFSTADVDGTPRWDQDHWPGANPPSDYHGGRVCQLVEIMADLAAGATAHASEFEARLPVSAVLGDSLPRGPYWISAQLKTNYGVWRGAAGPVDLRAP